MDIDRNRVDEAVLGLLHLVSFESTGVTRAWKGHDWDALNRLHESGLISDPRRKAKSVVLTEAGRLKAKQACEKLFGKTVNPLQPPAGGRCGVISPMECARRG